MDIGKIEILLDKRWELQDLSIVTKEYVQLYSFFYVTQCISERIYIDLDFSKYPWGGGYSVVNFFQKTYSLTSKEHRLKVTRIHYASPGIIELSGILKVAVDVAALVTTLCGSALAINNAYNRILSDYHKRELGKIKVQEAKSKLTQDNINFVHSSTLELVREFNLSPENINAIYKMSNENELVQLKMLLALYRRAKPIVTQQESGNMKLQ